MTATVQQSEGSLSSRVSRLIEADEVQLPPLPEVAVRARQLMESESVNTRALGELLSEDPAIVAALLRLANSAAFGGMGRIDNLTTAVQRIGLRQVGPIVTGLSLKGQFAHPSAGKREMLRTLWDHSVTSAFAARAIARKIGLEPERAFLAGLLHDCGKVLVLRALEAVESEGVAFPPTKPVLLELTRELHAWAGHRALTNWNLPDEVAEVALRHHEPAEDGDDLLLSVQAANLITRRLGFHPDPDPDLSVVEHPVIEDLGMDDLKVASLMIDMEDHLEEMKQLF